MAGERDVIAEDRDVNVLLRPDQLDAAPALRRGLPPSLGVLVSVLGRPLVLPEHALSEGLSDLRLTTEVYVAREDYARGVAHVLSALARDGITIFRA